MNRLLTVCYPTFNNQLHTNASNDSLILATDEILVGMMDRGWEVHAVSLCDPQGYPLMRSGLRLCNPMDIDPGSYDLIYHAFRDPTQPEVYNRLEELEWSDLDVPTLNHAVNLLNHHKQAYFKILNMHNIGPKTFDDAPPGVTWGETEHGATPSTDRKYIRTWGINNNRGNYPQRRSYEVIISEYIDNAAAGVRSFFRIGYALGRCCRGWFYASRDDLVIQKSGNSKHKIPFAMPHSYAKIVENAMNDVGIDLAHIEGCFIGERLYVFDINPFPTTYGATLKVTTEEMCDRIDKWFREGNLSRIVGRRVKISDSEINQIVSHSAEDLMGAIPDELPSGMAGPVMAEQVRQKRKTREKRSRSMTWISEPVHSEKVDERINRNSRNTVLVDDAICPRSGRPLPRLITPPHDLCWTEQGFDEILDQSMPMLTREEAYYILWFLTHLKPERVLEYGAGNSTKAFSQYITHWTTVEHNQEWAARIGCEMPNIRMICKTHSDETYCLEANIEEYCHPPELKGELFDLVFIDGDYRYQCIDRLRQVLKPGGIALVHDTRRPSFWERKGPMRYIYHLTRGEINTHHDPHQGLALLTDNEWKDWDSWLYSLPPSASLFVGKSVV